MTKSGLRILFVKFEKCNKIAAMLKPTKPKPFCACCTSCEMMTNNLMCNFGGPYIGYQDKDGKVISTANVKTPVDENPV